MWDESVMWPELQGLIVGFLFLHVWAAAVLWKTHLYLILPSAAATIWNDPAWSGLEGKMNEHIDQLNIIRLLF